MPRLVDKKRKKEQILDAAIKTFARRGTANTKMADIAEAAGIGKGTVYEYFRSKQEICRTAFQHVIEKAEATALKRTAAAEDPLDKLLAYLWSWKEILAGDLREQLEIMLDLWTEGIRSKDKEAAFSLKKTYDDHRLFLQEILGACVRSRKIRPVDTHLVASIIIGALDGMMVQWIIQPEVLDVEKSLAEMTEIVLRGLTEKGKNA